MVASDCITEGPSLVPRRKGLDDGRRLDEDQPERCAEKYRQTCGSERNEAISSLKTKGSAEYLASVLDVNFMHKFSLVEAVFTKFSTGLEVFGSRL